MAALQPGGVSRKRIRRSRTPTVSLPAKSYRCRCLAILSLSSNLVTLDKQRILSVRVRDHFSATIEASGECVIHRNVFHNDSLLPIEKVRLSPGQAGLICGWGIFTTMRISRGEAFAYERHWRRLEKDAALVRMPLPYTAAKVRVNLHEVIRANKVSDGCARIYLVNNSVGFWQSDEELPQVDLIICSASLPEYREPIRLGLREHGRHAASPLAGVKSISWLPNVWAVGEAQKEGFDEVVLLNQRGAIAEGTAANIFTVK